ALPFTPVVQFPLVICVLSAACFIRHKQSWVLFIAGFFWAAFRAGAVDTKLLSRDGWDADIAGVVESVDHADKNQRVFVRTLEGQTLRISIPKEIDCPAGADITLRAKRVYAPSSSDAFNRFDYRRWSFFNGLSGTGSAEDAKCSGGRPDHRSRMHFTADNKLADSLVLGYKNAIPRDDFDKIKTTGAAHVFSISGFHLAMVGGWLYFIFLCLSKFLFPFWARRVPARNLAIPATVIGLGFYLSISGMNVATIRSFIMAALGFLALFLNRKVFTLRNAAIVFAVMILARPFWLVSAGFQLSFSAIFGLIYYFSRRDVPKNRSRIRKFLAAVLMTNVIAAVWTAPFVIYHFGTFPIYTLLGNFVLLPVFSFGIMPFVFAGTITSMFGFRAPFQVSDHLYEFVIWFSERIAGLPFATVEFPDIPGVCLYLAFAGFFLFIMDKKKIARSLFIIATLWAFARPAPILRATADGEVVGFRKNGGTYFNVGYSEKHPFIIPRGKKLRADCKKGFCEYWTPKWAAASVQKFIPLYNNIDKLCGYDFIISRLPLTIPECQDKVIKGSVKIYSGGTIEKVVAREY
ncbi:MAG: ComEC/Rec2 family competence protein, partial [Rickettsiales bacterium]|nr:ComEC/Rec2 family competence protein [Rickettsiales bacterium]